MLIQRNAKILYLSDVSDWMDSANRHLAVSF